MKFFTFHIGDWMTATADLSPSEEFLYFKLLLRYYSQGCALNRAQIERLSNVQRMMSNGKVGNDIEYILETFFYLGEDGLYHNERADEEIKKQLEKSEKARKSVACRESHKKNNNNERTSNDNRTMNERTSNDELTINHIPYTNNIEEKKIKKEVQKKVDEMAERPESVSQEAWNTWLTIRKSKGSKKLTPYALSLLEKEAEIAHLTIAQAIDYCIRQNWVGFSADWINKPSRNNNSKPDGQFYSAPQFQTFESTLHVNEETGEF